MTDMNPETTGPTFASFYDFYDAAEFRRAQLGMYRDLAVQAGGEVLELACGTGIITLELARAAGSHHDLRGQEAKR